MADGDLSALIANADLPAIVGSFSELRKVGTEYLARCIFHAPDNNPSLSVYRKNGKWSYKCFSCDASGDALDFIEQAEGIERKEAIKKLNGGTTWTPRIAPEPLPPKVKRVTAKPPPDCPAPKFTHQEFGEPQQIIPFKDADGSILGYECRWPTLDKDGNPDKEVRMLTWGRHERENARWQWGWGHFMRPRHLCGLDELAARPHAPVLIVEGPGKRDAARMLLPQYVPISWTGGAGSWRHHDWEPIRGRRILIWPDNDPVKVHKNGDEFSVGIRAGQQLARLLADTRGLACQVKTIDPTGMADAFDVKDALAEGWTPEQTVAWAKPRISVYAASQQNPEAGQGVEGPPQSPTARPADGQAPEPPPEPEAQPAPAKPKRKGKSKPADESRYEDDDGSEAETCPLSEDDLSEQFAEANADRWRYVAVWGAWFGWRADGWYQDKTDEASRLMIEVCRAALYRPEARDMTGPQKRSLGRKATAWNARDMAGTHRRIAATADQWDQNRNLLGVPGGAIDLELGKLIEARPEHYITKRAAVAPERGVPELWTRFLNTVMAGNQDMIAYLQRFAGYCLTGETREQCLVFLYGTGQNGKGVFISTLSAILADYAATADADVFMATEHARHSEERARMRGARLVTVDETDGAKRWNEALIKRITGGAKMEARFMRQNTFEFLPEFKLLVAGNHKPQLRGVGKAIQRRFHLVPFTVTIPDEDRDDKLTEKLQAEYPRILQWMLDGCMAWRDYGLAPPEEVRDATEKYIQSEDTIGEWLEERTEHKSETLRPNAYKDYRNWMDGRGERAWSSKAWWAALEERGYAWRKTSGQIYIKDLALKSGGLSDDGPPAWHYSDSDR